MKYTHVRVSLFVPLVALSLSFGVSLCLRGRGQPPPLLSFGLPFTRPPSLLHFGCVSNEMEDDQRRERLRKWHPQDAHTQEARSAHDRHMTQQVRPWSEDRSRSDSLLLPRPSFRLARAGRAILSFLFCYFFNWYGEPLTD